MVELPWTRIIRVTALLSATVLASVLFGVTVKAIWALDDTPETVRVAPFTVIDPSGKMTNADRGLATLLISRLDNLKATVERSRGFIETKDEGRTYLDPKTPEALLTIIAYSSALDITEGNEAAPPLDLKIQGVDLTGIFAWIGRSLRERERAIAFAVNLDPDEGVSVAGDISDLGYEGASSLYVLPREQSLSNAVDDLAYALYQKSLARQDERFSHLDQSAFREMMIAVFALESAQFHKGFSDDKRRVAARNALDKINLALEQTPDWDKLWLVASRAARFADEPEIAAAALERANGAADLALAALGRDVETLSRSVRTAIKVGTAPAVAASVEDPEQPQGIVVRRDIDTLDPDGPHIVALREAFSRLEARPAEDPESLASLTAFYADYFSMGIRGGATPVSLFLPWNRAFLAHVERIIRKDDPTFAMPCWTFTSQGISFARIPEAYLIPSNREANPLYRSARSPTAVAGTEEGDFATRAGDILSGAQGFYQFSQSVETFSGRRHIWVGGRDGAMSLIKTAASDPLFYAHACGVDRLWAQWEARVGSPLGYIPKDGVSLLDQKLEPFGFTVKDVLNTRDLGYTYDFLPVD